MLVFNPNKMLSRFASEWKRRRGTNETNQIIEFLVQWPRTTSYAYAGGKNSMDSTNVW